MNIVPKISIEMTPTFRKKDTWLHLLKKKIYAFMRLKFQITWVKEKQGFFTQPSLGFLPVFF